MSDLLTEVCSPGEKSTQPQVTSLGNLNFSINMNIICDPELLQVLKTIVENISLIKPGTVKDWNDSVFEEDEVITDPRFDIPKENPKPNKKDVIISPKKQAPKTESSNKSIYNRKSDYIWSESKRNPLLSWTLKNDELIICYSSNWIFTSWTHMIGLSKLDEAYRTIEIKKLLGSQFTPNKRTAYNTFCKLINEGEIKPPASEIEAVLKAEEATKKRTITPTNPRELKRKLEGMA